MTSTTSTTTTSTAGATAASTASSATAPTAVPEHRRLNLGRIAAWAAMVLIIMITVLPFYWVLRTALSSNAGLASDPTSLLPVEANLRGFQRVFGLQSPEEAIADGGSGASLNFWIYLRNSVIVSTLVTVGQVFFSAMAAYSFARLRWPGRDAVFGVFLAALMVPSIFTLLPNFVLVKELGLVDSMLGVASSSTSSTPSWAWPCRRCS